MTPTSSTKPLDKARLWFCSIRFPCIADFGTQSPRRYRTTALSCLTFAGMAIPTSAKAPPPWRSMRRTLHVCSMTSESAAPRWLGSRSAATRFSNVGAAFPNAFCLVLSNTKASADSSEARAVRLRSAAEVLEHGVQPFVDSMIPKLIGKTTQFLRPDLVEGARRMALKMSPQDVSQVQQGHGGTSRFDCDAQDNEYPDSDHRRRGRRAVAAIRCGGNEDEQPGSTPRRGSKGGALHPLGKTRGGGSTSSTIFRRATLTPPQWPKEILSPVPTLAPLPRPTLR